MPGITQKILTEIWHHFWLKMRMKSGLEKNILKFHGGLQRYLLTCQANSAFLGRFFCTGQQQLWRPSWNLKIIFSRPLFIIIFKPKMVSNLCKNFLCINPIYLIQLENFRSTFASKGFPSRMIQVLTILQSHNLHIFEMSAFMLKEIEKNVFNLSKKSYFAVVLYFIKSKTFIIDNFKG